MEFVAARKGSFIFFPPAPRKRHRSLFCNTPRHGIDPAFLFFTMLFPGLMPTGALVPFPLNPGFQDQASTQTAKLRLVRLRPGPDLRYLRTQLLQWSAARQTRARPAA